MNPTTLITGGVTTILGILIGVLGLAAIEAGKGGYGQGPLPFLKTRRHWDLIIIGAALAILGSFLATVGLRALNVL